MNINYYCRKGYKNLIILLSLFVISSAFALPNPGGKASIRNGLPSGSTPPETIRKTSNVTFPVPTNKWFNSALNNIHNQFSLRMFTYPQTVKIEGNALLIGYPRLNTTANDIKYGYDASAYAYHNALKITAYKNISGSNVTSNPLSASKSELDAYSDWAATVKWTDSSKWMKASFGQGFLFTYFEFEDSLYPAIEFPYAWTHASNNRYYVYRPDNNTPLADGTSVYAGDRIILEARLPDGNKIFYGIFAPSGTQFKQDIGDNWYKISIQMPAGGKYMSVALLPSTTIAEAQNDLKTYYPYAYNFVTNTNVNWSVVSNQNAPVTAKSEFRFSFVKKRISALPADGTLFALMPHQYNNPSLRASILKGTFDTLRGNMKIASGSGFSYTNTFYGMIPFFKYNMSAAVQTDIENYLNTDKDMNLTTGYTDTYKRGKEIAKLANMIPVADNLNRQDWKTEMISRLKTELENWFTYNGSEANKYFGYDNTWGGLIGINNSYGSESYNDHHFHYGYFIYAAAFLAMYDPAFAAEYGGMVELLIKDIANPIKNDPNFPYMRVFDFYESHSWANGMGGQDDRGIDQESSSEAMNAWSAIYLWGLVTNQNNYRDLGIYLYTNEYQSIKNYYFDIEQNILKLPYNHNSVGILWGGLAAYNLHFDEPPTAPKSPHTIKGIQILPLTPLMMYLGYDKEYVNKFYSQADSEGVSTKYVWYDVWARMVALYNPVYGIARFDENKNNYAAEEGSSKSFTYHFLNFFKEIGDYSNKYVSDYPSYIITEKYGKTTFHLYNPYSVNKTARFYNGSTGAYAGNINMSPLSFVSVSELIQDTGKSKIQVYPVPYKPGSKGRYDGEGITFLDIGIGTKIRIFNIAGELVFETAEGGSGSDFYVWDTRNKSGNKVASGIYIYYVETKDKGSFKGKLAIER